MKIKLIAYYIEDYHSFLVKLGNLNIELIEYLDEYDIEHHIDISGFSPEKVGNLTLILLDHGVGIERLWEF